MKTSRSEIFCGASGSLQSNKLVFLRSKLCIIQDPHVPGIRRGHGHVWVIHHGQWIAIPRMDAQHFRELQRATDQDTRRRKGNDEGPAACRV